MKHNNTHAHNSSMVDQIVSETHYYIIIYMGAQYLKDIQLLKAFTVTDEVYNCRVQTVTFSTMLFIKPDIL